MSMGFAMIVQMMNMRMVAGVNGMTNHQTPHQLLGPNFSPSERVIVQLLSNAYPGKLHSKQLAVEVYGKEFDENGADYNKNIRKMMSTIRTKLIPYEWTVPKARAESGYGIVRKGEISNAARN